MARRHEKPKRGLNCDIGPPLELVFLAAMQGGHARFCSNRFSEAGIPRTDRTPGGSRVRSRLGAGTAAMLSAAYTEWDCAQGFMRA
jgi:hypothetical protein